MGYVKPSAGSEIDLPLFEALARLLGLATPPDEAATMAATVGAQFASLDELDELDLTDIAPAVEFDPRWES